MVDVSASFRAGPRGRPAGASYASSAGQVETAIFTEQNAALAAYADLARQARFTPPQSPAWISAWVEETGADPVVATLAIGGQPALSLALEVVRKGPFKVARFMGGHHANGNFAPLVADAPRIRRSDIDALIAAIRKARPDIDMLSLERIVEEHEGLGNPLMALPKLPSPNVSLAVDLNGGFEALLKRSSGKRKKKKHRSQIRKFELVGPWRCLQARTPDEVERVLADFFEMKRIRLTKMGVEDVFGTAEVQRFFGRLFREVLDAGKPAFLLNALEVGGTIRAVTGSSIMGKRVICEFGAISEDELFYASPGDFLFFEEIRNACDAGMDFYDFSVGDEHYKRLWCDIEATHFDVTVPLTAKGRVFAGLSRGKTRLKTFVKRNAFVWAMTKRWRRRNAAPAAEASDGDE
jgi:CelD/BcsL family acetyltransferase involved in cellulose biosynthesis